MKGTGDCGARPAISLPSGEGGSPPVPGRSKRAQHVYQLLTQAAPFEPDYLLTDPRPGGKRTPASRAESHLMAHQAFKHWLPSSYRGHPGFIPAHEQTGHELLHVVLLDGDRKANHTFFYREPSGGEWTLAAGLAAARHYRLPLDEQDGLRAQGLQQAIERAPERPSFLQALRARPATTLAECAPPVSQEEARAQLAVRLPLTPEAQRQLLEEAHPRELSQDLERALAVHPSADRLSLPPELRPEQERAWLERRYQALLQLRFTSPQLGRVYRPWLGREETRLRSLLALSDGLPVPRKG